MSPELAENVIQLGGIVSFVFVFLNLTWMISHFNKFKIQTIIIGAILTLYQGVNFLLQAFYAATLVSLDLNTIALVCYFVLVDLAIVTVAILNSFYNCRVKIKL
jgi:hypothetical protein